jgi:hypothetical protein
VWVLRRHRGVSAEVSSGQTLFFCVAALCSRDFQVSRGESQAALTSKDARSNYKLGEAGLPNDLSSISKAATS